MLRAFRLRPAKGITLIEVLIALIILGILVAIALPKVLSAQQKARYARAACESKTAVVQGIVYSNERNANPGRMQTLRESGYVNIDDADPWGAAWIYSVAFADSGSPAHQGEMGVCSLGPAGTGDCTFPPPAPETGPNGSVGYSSIYGAWQGLP